jgi:glycosyltransferase involved in cell wall biosynthesis
MDDPFFLYVGFRDRYKNFDVVAQALSLMDPDSGRLVVVGPPWTPEERAQLNHLGIEHRVEFLGFLDDAGLARTMRSAVALVHSSLYEGFGLTIVEALATGCPVIASSIPTSLEIAEGYALFFDPGDPSDLARQMRATLEEGRGSTRAVDGRSRALDFTWEASARALHGVYMEVGPLDAHQARRGSP